MTENVGAADFKTLTSGRPGWQGLRFGGERYMSWLQEWFHGFICVTSFLLSSWMSRLWQINCVLIQGVFLFFRKVLHVVTNLLSELRATSSYKTLLDPRI